MYLVIFHHCCHCYISVIIIMFVDSILCILVCETDFKCTNPHLITTNLCASTISDCSCNIFFNLYSTSSLIYTATLPFLTCVNHTFSGQLSAVYTTTPTPVNYFTIQCNSPSLLKFKRCSLCHCGVSHVCTARLFH